MVWPETSYSRDRDLKKEILDEAHFSNFTIHPGTPKCTKTSGKIFGGQT
jgi:hypothetical protein